MQQKWKDVATAVIMGLVLPHLMLNAATMWTQTQPLTILQTEETRESAPEISSLLIRVRMGDRVEILELEEYLVGVVLGEMPAVFEPEALKAQAVVARTYTLRRCALGSKHADADICTDPACCQAYRDADRYDGGQELLNKVRTAVDQTRNMVLTYAGDLIEATYFSSSGGRTEDAVAVWGRDLPYLQATDSPEADYVEQYLQTVTFTPDAFQQALGRALPGKAKDWFSTVTYTNGGGVDTMEICGVSYSGVELRQMLGLRSTAFTVSPSESMIMITTRGYGHRVGMSQYGAEAMAVEGHTFEEILAHYYRGTDLEEYIDIDLDIG